MTTADNRKYINEQQCQDCGEPLGNWPDEPVCRCPRQCFCCGKKRPGKFHNLRWFLPHAYYDRHASLLARGRYARATYRWFCFRFVCSQCEKSSRCVWVERPPDGVYSRSFPYHPAVTLAAVREVTAKRAALRSRAVVRLRQSIRREVCRVSEWEAKECQRLLREVGTALRRRDRVALDSLRTEFGRLTSSPPLCPPSSRTSSKGA
jgi:hypothetical protein